MVFQALNENKFNPRILSPAKLSFKPNVAIKSSTISRKENHI
jgi:hypothetical protein